MSPHDTVIEWFDDLDGGVATSNSTEPPLRVDHAKRRWADDYGSDFQPTAHTFGIEGNNGWWIVRVAPPDDITPQVLERLKADMLDMVRLRYGWTE